MPTKPKITIVGAGLAGLTSAYELAKRGYDCHVIERSGTAGGLTGNWIDERLGPDKKFQTPMHMDFINKYHNFTRLINEIGGILSPLYEGYNIITSDETKHRLEMNDWSSRILPPPLHGLGMFRKLKMPLLAKWDFMKLAAVSTYCAREMLTLKQEPKAIPNTLSLESLELILNINPHTRDFIESVTPSIYNLHPWYTSAPRMAAVIAGTMTMNRDSLHYHVFGKNYNAAFIDKFVDQLKEIGVTFDFWTEVRRIESKDGEKVDHIWVQHYGPEHGGQRYSCQNCGAENYCLDRAFCTRCGLDTTLDKIRQGLIKNVVGSELWANPRSHGYQSIKCEKLITATYPHVIAKLIPTNSPLRRLPYVRSCFSTRGNQTQLSIGRVYYKEPVTRDEMFITGTHNPHYCFNGCQSVYNNFGGEDLGWKGDVIDVLLDVGIIRDAHSPRDQIKRIVKDLHRVYPDADPRKVACVSFANIYPEVLYLSEQPAIAGLHRFFNTHRTGAKNWYVAGCHSGLIGIGMESAVESALSTANCILEDDGRKTRVPVIPYDLHFGSRVFAKLGRAILWWKTRGHNLRRRAETKYSL